MNLRLIRWQLPLSYAVIALLAVLLLGVILTLILQRFYIGQEIIYLTENAYGIGLLAGTAIETDMQTEAIQQLFDIFAVVTNTQVRLLDVSGKTLIDTGSPQSRLAVSLENMMGFELSESGSESSLTIVQSDLDLTEEDLSGQISGSLLGEGEISMSYVLGPYGGLWMSVPGAGARIGGFPKVTPERSNQTIRQPVYSRDKSEIGTVELSNGPAYGREIVRSVLWGWTIAGSVAVLLAAAVGWLVSTRFSAPLNALTDVTHQMSMGNLSVRAKASTLDEFGTLGSSFNDMAEHIESLVSTLRNFVTDAAHELNTPLTALHTNLELVAEAGPELSLEDLKQAQEQADRLIILVNSLLELSQIEASVKSNRMINIRDLVENVGEIYASRAEQEEIIFLLKVPDDEVLVAGDPSQLRRMLENLLNNALKFTPLGGSVELELDCDDKQSILRVKDTGIGIPVRDQENVFQRFFRGRNAYAYPGNGLGLAIVKMIVEKHHGEIYLESSSQGTCILVRLPRSATSS